MTAIEFNYQLTELQKYLEVFAKQLTGNEDDAKDLLQETFLKALVYREKYVNQNNFKAWVYTIMKNIFINNYRKIVRNQTVIDKTEDLHHLNLPQNSGFESPESSYSAGEIRNSINAFADEYRIPFSMHVQGYKYEEIAEKMKLPIGTVKSRIFLARKRLQEQLKDYRY
jgi:RNA polymerase sigma-70 factor (ECF subfamily)